MPKAPYFAPPESQANQMATAPEWQLPRNGKSTPAQPLDPLTETKGNPSQTLHRYRETNRQLSQFLDPQKKPKGTKPTISGHGVASPPMPQLTGSLGSRPFDSALQVPCWRCLEPPEVNRVVLSPPPHFFFLVQSSHLPEKRAPSRDRVREFSRSERLRR